jgi:CheY-like chemotaxis protein
MPQFPILHVEDDPNDVLLLWRAIARAHLPITYFAVEDAFEAVSYLSGRPPYDDRNRFPIPALLVVDIKMPGLDGFHVLEWAQANPETAEIPVFILSSSNLPLDVRKAHELGAMACFLKSPNFREVIAAISSLLPRALAPAAGQTTRLRA